MLSSFLDNIAAAMIGGAMAHALYRGRVHVGYLAAIVAASNGGGSGSVVGDTTTTMMWIDGVKPLQVLEAYAAAIPALAFFGVVAARQQQALQPIMKDAPAGVRADRGRIAVVVAVLAAAIVVNVVAQVNRGSVLDRLPAIGLGVWVALLVCAPLVPPDWRVLPSATRGAIFLVSLVLSASMMPVEALPAASWAVTLGLGFDSAVFDNIPLTALALRQGGYDWGFLAYAVGFGGSMVWFGSSAGVALASQFAEARSARAWSPAGTSRSPTCSASPSSSPSSAGIRTRRARSSPSAPLAIRPEVGAPGRWRLRRGNAARPIPQSATAVPSRRHRRVGRIRRGNRLALDGGLGSACLRSR